MKSFLEFLIENNSNNNFRNFIWAVDGNREFSTAPSHLDHITAFDPIYFGHDQQKIPTRNGRVNYGLVARSWGRVVDGVATIVTPEGAEPPSNVRNKRTLEDDIFDRIHAIEQLEQFPGIVFHAGAEDGKAILHSPTQYKKHLTSFLGGD